MKYRFKQEIALLLKYEFLCVAHMPNVDCLKGYQDTGIFFLTEVYKCKTHKRCGRVMSKHTGSQKYQYLFWEEMLTCIKFFLVLS